MNKKLLFILLAGTMLSVCAVRAQEQATADDAPAVQMMPKRFDRNHHKAMAAKLASDLGLTEEQKAKAEQIRQEGQAKIAPLMEQMKSLRQKIDDERRTNMQAFEEILTPEQKQRFEVMKQQHDRRFKEGPKHEGEGRMMRGIHRIGDDGEMLPPPPHDDKNWKKEIVKHHKNKVKDEYRKKDKGGFIDKENVYQGGGFVED